MQGNKKKKTGGLTLLQFFGYNNPVHSALFYAHLTAISLNLSRPAEGHLPPSRCPYSRGIISCMLLSESFTCVAILRK